MYSNTPAVVIDAAGAEFDRLVISSASARDDAVRIDEAARGTDEGRRPSPS